MFFLNAEVFREPDSTLGIIFGFCIPIAVISIIYCVMGYFSERHYRVMIQGDGLYYSSRTCGDILSPSSTYDYTAKGISHYKETGRYFIVYGTIEWTASGSTNKSKKVKIPKMFSNMHLLRDYLDQNEKSDR